MKRKLIIAASLATAGALAIAGTVMADDRGGRGMGMGGGRGHRPFGGIILLALVGAVVGLVVWLVARRRPALAVAGMPMAPVAPMASPIASAETILAERLARSEINTDEYRVSLAALRESAGVAAPAAPWSPVAPESAADGGEATSPDGANS